MCLHLTAVHQALFGKKPEPEPEQKGIFSFLGNKQAPKKTVVSKKAPKKAAKKSGGFNPLTLLPGYAVSYKQPETMQPAARCESYC